MNATPTYDREICSTLEAYRARLESEADIVEMLQTQGITYLLAEKLVALVPLAFGRVLLSHMPEHPTFSKTAVLEAEDGTLVPVDLQTEPIFRRAVELATEMYHRGPRELFGPAATASAELSAANHLLHSGATLRGVAFTEPRFLRVSFEDWLREESS
ncbi:MAG: hypothetical protein HY825_01955 [Acidobacteria bacterium]|nr:hypothetical protein [Acidobacteriota bacterium]